MILTVHYRGYPYDDADEEQQQEYLVGGAPVLVHDAHPHAGRQEVVLLERERHFGSLAMALASPESAINSPKGERHVLYRNNNRVVNKLS